MIAKSNNNFPEINQDGLLKARVIAEHRELYQVRTSSHEYFAKVTGKQMHEASSREDYPAVGDWVLVEALPNDQAIIKKILPRKTVIKKRQSEGKIQIIAANVDVVFIVESIDRDYNLNRLERYCTLCLEQKIKPVVIISKIDLIRSDELDAKLAEIKKRLKDVDVIPTSISTPEDLQKLKSFVQKDITYCFLGSSGVGKSSMINKLIGGEIIRTGEIGEQSGRGKHTTTRRDMFFLENGGILIDNPGMREVGLADFESGIGQVFNDIATVASQCKFADCTHISEPGCAVLEALKSGQLDKDQYENYLRLKKEVDHFDMSEQEKREKDRKFGKFIKKSLKTLDEIDRYK